MMLDGLGNQIALDVIECIARLRTIGPLNIFSENLLPPGPSLGNHTTSICMAGKKRQEFQR